MKIAVTSTGPTLDDYVEVRFGRCAYFLVIDPDTLDCESIRNPNIDLGGGAGIQSAHLLANKDVTVVMTGNCGPNAFQTFGAAGIQVITGIAGKVRDAVQMYKSGAVSAASAPSVQSQISMGRGMGRSMGMGGGRGMGRGMVMRQGSENVQPEDKASSSSPGLTVGKEEVAELKEQVEALKKQMERITARLKEREREVK